MRKNLLLLSTVAALFMLGLTITSSAATTLRKKKRGLPDDTNPARKWYRMNSIGTQSELDEELRRLDALTTDAGPDGGAEVPKLAPALDYWQEMYEPFREGIVPSVGRDSGFVDFTAIIYKYGDTGVYLLLENEDYVIKYHRFCSTAGLEPIDSMVVEWYFLKDLEHGFSHPITHKAVYLSASVEENPDWPRKGKLAENPFTVCDDGSFPKIRFMISERTGNSVKDYLAEAGLIDVVTAAKMGVQMIRLLQQLHETKGYIHGDVHDGNFAVSATDPNKLILIDFGRARIVDAIMLSEDSFVFQKETFDCHMSWSQWQTRGLVASFRDDVYRALTVIAASIHGKQFEDAVNGFCDAIAHYYQVGVSEYLKMKHWMDSYMLFKERANFFDIYVEKFDLDLAKPAFFDLTVGSRLKLEDEYLAADNHKVIRRKFEEALNVVRSTRIQDMPNYDRIIGQLLEIIKLDPREDQNNPSTDIDFTVLPY